MRFLILLPLLVSPIASAGEGDAGEPDAGQPDAGPAPGSYSHLETFERFRVGEPPMGFLYRRTGKGAPARWTIRELARPRPTRVLAQTDADRTTPRHPQALLDNFPIRDVRIATHCRVLSGRDERSCGVVLRHQSEKAYYLARLSLRDANVCLFRIEEDPQKKLERRELGCAPVSAAPGRWYGLAASARRGRLEAYFSGKKVLEIDDATYPDAGRVGLWTGNDTVAEFDDSRADPL